MDLTETDRERIARAVAEAESKTSGEIVVVIARQVSTYAEVPLAWAAAATLLVPPIAVALGARPLALSGALGEWVVGHVGALDAVVAGAIGAYALAQAILFFLVWLAFSIPAVRRGLTPGVLKAARVRQAAIAQYVASGLPAREEATGVVIFAALDEHRVEVIAEPHIDEKCGEGAWERVVEAVIRGMKARDPAGGFVAAIDICGDVLAEHFPDDAGPNRVPDRPVEI